MTNVGRFRATLTIAAAVAAALLGAAVAFAADPTSTPGAGGDPRSEGEGPGFVGQPLAAIGLVLVVAVGAILVTLIYVRLTDRRSR